MTTDYAITEEEVGVIIECLALRLDHIQGLPDLDIDQMKLCVNLDTILHKMYAVQEEHRANARPKQVRSQLTESEVERKHGVKRVRSQPKRIHRKKR